MQGVVKESNNRKIIFKCCDSVDLNSTWQKHTIQILKSFQIALKMTKVHTS